MEESAGTGQREITGQRGTEHDGQMDGWRSDRLLPEMVYSSLWLSLMRTRKEPSLFWEASNNFSAFTRFMFP